MLIIKRAVCVMGIIVPPCASLSVRNFSACQQLSSSKRPSPYSSVDSERYSSLVKSVMSSRVSSQTPETLQAEDEQVYGPVVKGQAPSSRAERRVPKTLHPFLHSEEGTLETEEPESGGPPARIVLNRGEGRSLVPSVTRIIQQTLSPEQIFYLERWKRRMITQLGEEGFREYSQNLFRQGRLFHSALEDILTSGATLKNKETPEEHPPEVRGYMESISHVLEDVSAVRATESTVQHDTLNYLGIVDCVARYRGVLCVIDWKTSEKPKPFLSNTYDNPIQVAAYAGALNNDDNYKYQPFLRHTSKKSGLTLQEYMTTENILSGIMNPSPKILNHGTIPENMVGHGLIVVAYKDGSPAHAHELSSELMLEYWKKWLIRLEDFTGQRSSHASSAFVEKR